MVYLGEDTGEKKGEMKSVGQVAPRYPRSTQDGGSTRRRSGTAQACRRLGEARIGTGVGDGGEEGKGVVRLEALGHSGLDEGSRRRSRS